MGSLSRASPAPCPAAALKDFEFHDTIVRLCGNRLVREILVINRDAIRESRKLPLGRHNRLRP